MHLFRGCSQHRKRYPRPLQHLERQYRKRISRSEKLRQKRTIECTLCEHSIVMNYTAKENQAQSGFLSPFLRPAKNKNRPQPFRQSFLSEAIACFFFFFHFSAVHPRHSQSCIFNALYCCAAAFIPEPALISRICRILLLSSLLSQCPCAASCR